MTYIPFTAFAPDADTTSPGIIVDCANAIPSPNNTYYAAPAAVSSGYAALSAACQGAVAVRKLDNSVRVFAATQTRIYEGISLAWTDRSAGGAAYTGGSDNRWRFAQYGNVTLAVNKADVLQASTTGAFSALTAPKASMVETVLDFVVLADTNEGTYGDSPDRVWFSSLSDYTTWTPSTATQGYTTRLTDTPGPIRAIKRFNDDLIVYKERGMWRGVYNNGSAIVWSFYPIAGDVGTPSQEAVVSIGDAHIFLGYEDFYILDGSMQPRSIGTNVIKNWFFSRLSRSYVHRVAAMHDILNSLVYFYYPSSTGGGVLDSCVVYNYKANKWGIDDRSIEIPVSYINSSEITYDALGSYFSTYADLPSIPYDSPTWVSYSLQPAIFNTSHTLQTLTGSGTTMTLTTGDYGVDGEIALLKRARLRCKTSPTSGTMINYYRDDIGSSLTTDTTTTLSGVKADFLRAARWHRAKFELTGASEVYGMDVTIQGAGIE